MSKVKVHKLSENAGKKAKREIKEINKKINEWEKNNEKRNL